MLAALNLCGGFKKGEICIEQDCKGEKKQQAVKPSQDSGKTGCTAPIN